MRNIYEKYLSESIINESESKVVKQSNRGLESELTLSIKKEVEGEDTIYFNIEKWVLKSDKGASSGTTSGLFEGLFSFDGSKMANAINEVFGTNLKVSILIDGERSEKKIPLHKLTSVIAKNVSDEEMKQGVDISDVFKKEYPKLLMVGGW